MFQNDLTFNYEDLKPPIKHPRAIIEDLLEKHDENGVAGAFFYAHEVDARKAELPEGWSLSIDENTTVEPTKIRITIYHAYDEACRTFDEHLKPVQLIGSRIGGELIVITSPELFSELEWARGESYVKILVTPGAAFGIKSREFYADDTVNAVKFLSKIGCDPLSGAEEDQKGSAVQDESFIFITQIGVDHMDEFKSEILESEQLQFLAELVMDFANATLLRVQSDTTFYLRIRPVAGGLAPVEFGREGKDVPHFPAIKPGPLLHSIKRLNFSSAEIIHNDAIEIAFVVNSSDHWDYNFLKVSEYVSYPFTVFGYHPVIKNFARQIYSDGDYDAGIEVNPDEEGYVGADMLDRAGLTADDFDTKSYTRLKC